MNERKPYLSTVKDKEIAPYATMHSIMHSLPREPEQCQLVGYESESCVRACWTDMREWQPRGRQESNGQRLTTLQRRIRSRETLQTGEYKLTKNVSPFSDCDKGRAS